MSYLPPEEVDVVVIGDSLTGRLSAIALAGRGLRVAAMTSLFDGQHLERMIEVPRTPVNEAMVSGVEFAERSWERAKQLGVVAGDYVSKVTLADDRFVVLDLHDEERLAKKIVFAPAGHEPRDHAGPLYELLGLAISADAWSDAPFVAKWKATAAVIGCGFRAAEEALQCVRAGVSDVLVLCDDASCFGPLERRVAREQSIRTISHARLGDLHMDQSGKRLEAIDVVERDRVHREPCGLVFLARGVECDTTLIHPFRGNPNVILAGLAHGIPSDDYPAMVADVARVVDEVCR